jgi:hypothetical protein
MLIELRSEKLWVITRVGIWDVKTEYPRLVAVRVFWRNIVLGNF